MDKFVFFIMTVLKEKNTDFGLTQIKVLKIEALNFFMKVKTKMLDDVKKEVSRNDGIRRYVFSCFYFVKMYPFINFCVKRKDKKICV